MASTATLTAPTTAPPLERYQLLALLQVLDVATTWFILGHLGSHAEGNPVIGAFIDHGGLSMAMTTLLVFKLAVVYVLYEKRTGVNLMSAVYGLVVFNNLLALVLAVM